MYSVLVFYWGRNKMANGEIFCPYDHVSEDFLMQYLQMPIFNIHLLVDSNLPKRGKDCKIIVG